MQFRAAQRPSSSAGLSGSHLGLSGSQPWKAPSGMHALEAWETRRVANNPRTAGGGHGPRSPGGSHTPQGPLPPFHDAGSELGAQPWWRRFARSFLAGFGFLVVLGLVLAQDAIQLGLVGTPVRRPQVLTSALDPACVESARVSTP